MEIEKKFLLLSVPENLEAYAKKEIEQGYLNRKPTLRIRKSNDDYILTYKNKSDKSESTICNEEIEAPLTREAYEHLREKTDGYLISKTRYIIPIGTCEMNCPGLKNQDDLQQKLKIELDVFKGRLEGLVFAEVEFPSLEAAECFKKPDWFGRDVSADLRYRNGHLSMAASLEDM